MLADGPCRGCKLIDSGEKRFFLKFEFMALLAWKGKGEI
jgi:hypothetical protein